MSLGSVSRRAPHAVSHAVAFAGPPVATIEQGVQFAAVWVELRAELSGVVRTGRDELVCGVVLVQIARLIEVGGDMNGAAGPLQDIDTGQVSPRC